MSGAGRARGARLALLGIAAISQRAYVTLWRQPVLIISTMLFPVVYLLVLGNALNRQLRAIPVAIVNESGNALAAECVRGAMALESGRDLLRITPVADRDEALRGLRRGRFRAVWVLPFGLSRQGPTPSFVGDNTDRFSFDTVEGALREVWDTVSASSGPAGRLAVAPAVRLEAYPYLDYLTYLAPAVVCLAIFMGSMVSGGLQVIEDRMFGYHEGYLVTPISTGTLVAGHILAGSLVASLAGDIVLVAILVTTPMPTAGLAAVLACLLTVFLTSLAISSVWFQPPSTAWRTAWSTSTTTSPSSRRPGGETPSSSASRERRPSISHSCRGKARTSVGPRSPMWSKFRCVISVSPHSVSSTSTGSAPRATRVTSARAVVSRSWSSATSWGAMAAASRSCPIRSWKVTLQPIGAIVGAAGPSLNPYSSSCLCQACSRIPGSSGTTLSG